MTGAKKPDPNKDLASMSVSDLIELRREVEAFIPAKALADLNLEKEIVIQYQSAQALLNSVSTDEGVPANQKATVQNSCANTLDQLLKMQVRIHTSERLKRIEQSLIKVVKTLPKEQQEQFFADYERIYTMDNEAT